MIWAYGVTTVDERFCSTFQSTIASLKNAGFDAPRLFLDDKRGFDQELQGFQVTTRSPRILPHGNWFLGLHELWIRNPKADRFAIFQDDIVTYRNLRGYLESIPWPGKAYLNLYTCPSKKSTRFQKLPPSPDYVGWYKSNQRGIGALALVFDRNALLALLTSRHMVKRPLSPDGWRSIDGGVSASMKKAGFVEMIHNPSLVQHIGDVSTILNNGSRQSERFLGEDFDAMDLLKLGSAIFVADCNRCRS